ncbi:MAG: MATE family efflux transporter [Erysipelotrichaceae bacterium]
MNDLTKGNIFKSLMVFMIPILMANIFQQLYNTADTMIVGHYLGDNALAAMGATASVFELLVGFANGVGNGYSVVIARFIGARDNIRVKKAVATGIILTAILSLIIMGLSISILRPLMTLLNTPEEIFEVAYGYLFTVCIFVAVTAFYNLSGGILRAKGNSFIPLIMLFISSVLNIILDIIFIGYMHMGVKGAAVATVIAQFVSAILCITYILVKEKDILPDKEHFIYDRDIYKDMIAQGLSMGLMMSIVSMGTVILSGAINKLGKEIIASYISARKIMSFGLIIISTLASSLTTFVSQNLGAKEYQRINDGIKISTGISIIWSLIISMGISPLLAA